MIPTDTDAPPQPQATENNTTSSLRFRVAAAIATKNGGLEMCYDVEMARAFALAYLGSPESVMEADGLEDKLKRHFKADLNLQRLRKSIKLIRDQIIDSAAPEDSAGYIRTSEGTIRPILANAITAMSGLDLAYDSFQNRVVLRSDPPWGSAGLWNDDDDLYATESLQRQGILVENPRTTNSAARRVSLRKPYHPVKDWLTSLEWDKTPRLDFWLSTYLGVPENELTMDFARMWMISAVARIFEPGCKADCMLVLESKQGYRKSSALRMLVNGHLDAGREPFWFRDRIPTLSSEDVGLHMQGVWVIEIAELDAIRRSAAWTATKNFISDQSDTFRRKYGINLQEYPRQCVFAGSTNEKEWMGDPTGGRRFWAVNVTAVDLKGIQQDREQLWAEAVHCYASGCPWHLSEEQEKQAREEIESRMPEDVWQERVTAVVDQLVVQDPDDSVSVASILEAMKIDIRQQGQAEQNRVAKVLRSLGYSKYRSSVGKRPWRYRKG